MATRKTHCVRDERLRRVGAVDLEDRRASASTFATPGTHAAAPSSRVDTIPPFARLLDGPRPRPTPSVDVTRIFLHVETIEDVLRALVREVADACWVDVVADVGLVRVAAAARDPRVELLLCDLAGGPTVDSSGLHWRAAPLVEPAVPAPTHVDLLRALGATTFVRAPLLVGDEPFGAVTAASIHRGLRFGIQERRVVEAAARRLARLVADDCIAAA